VQHDVDRQWGVATSQASPDGLSVYERLDFRRVATLRGYLRSVGGIVV
jgi:hypothetical protein